MNSAIDSLAGKVCKAAKSGVQKVVGDPESCWYSGGAQGTNCCFGGLESPAAHGL